MYGSWKFQGCPSTGQRWAPLSSDTTGHPITGFQGSTGPSYHDYYDNAARINGGMNWGRGPAPRFQRAGMDAVDGFRGTLKLDIPGGRWFERRGGYDPRVSYGSGYTHGSFST
ncbi:hypothetical protein KC318_g7566 [Hortaea werneckii]|uniref:Uncharacterized protein n=1 Tax=Hortaea werneckii TaxID=91943 RepID=A0A3M7BM15_HORWE|nr:hypothetical protein KC334_g15329 [Hortaea werneckii]KAI7017872.1 hypothetical protein KC355_g3530 [Hortaea werneckii]KAI7664730.1 hypothetical protein KC318_g7566 [Hortaea werneckii]RMY19448.1 hypothetical protein D0867_04679 [Hortaea werneckii]RMY40789.1 hypothetical protein D0866_01040 [Hortaea werneckii]